MYLTRTAGIETVFIGLVPYGDGCILPAMRELKLITVR